MIVTQAADESYPYVCYGKQQFLPLSQTFTQPNLLI